MIRCCEVDITAFGHNRDCPLDRALHRVRTPQDASDSVPKLPSRETWYEVVRERHRAVQARLEGNR